MLSIAHLIDDVATGGVNRAIHDQCASLKDSFNFSIEFVNSRRALSPKILHDIAIVHFTASWAKLPFLTMLRAQRFASPVLLVEHTYTRGFEQHCVPNPGRFRSMLRLSYRLVDKVVAVSHGQAKWMLEAELLPPEKLVVIQQSVDCTSLLQIPIARKAPGGSLRVLAYGRYCQQKAFETAIDAMLQLPPGLATLTLAGYGPDEQSLKVKAANLPNVIIGPIVTDLRGLLAGHDVVLVPSRWEAFGLVCLEARAAGRAIVSSAVDGLREQVQDSFGRLCPPDDPVAFATAVREAADSDITAMGHAARASVHLHEERYRDGYLKLWNQMVS